MTVKFKRVRPDAVMPFFGSEGAAAADLSACITEPVTIEPGQWVSLPTGLAMELPSSQYVGLIFPRSGLGIKHGITLRNGTGVIDSDYRGEISVALVNGGSSDFTVEPGMRIAQLMITTAFRFEAIECEELSQTHRGEGGFGSTGIK